MGSSKSKKKKKFQNSKSVDLVDEFFNQDSEVIMSHIVSSNKSDNRIMLGFLSKKDISEETMLGIAECLDKSYEWGKKLYSEYNEIRNEDSKDS